ncbi:hypothetical protein LCGC14_0297900 [marine sediment metagenome]|uniref:Uncharacterized protein n=1 Tax=marine sediment metagenome TaxID=412755 RepID=A0A0F9WCJ6_9ZZZZ
MSGNSNNPENTEIVVAEVATGLAVVGTPEQMEAKLEDFGKQREIITKYVEDNLVEGKDYGPAYEGSKRTLLKPGAEKVCRLFNTRPTWKRDDETWEMLGSPAGVVCYLCHIIDNVTGKIVGEGRGAERVGNKKRDANKTIKIAEKCALVDAALYTFCLSEMFTQDDGGLGNGNGAASLEDEKVTLKAEVAHKRVGCESSLTDAGFIRVAAKVELHKDHIDTLGELAHMRKVLIEDAAYDWATGERIPANINGSDSDKWEHE